MLITLLKNSLPKIFVLLLIIFIAMGIGWHLCSTYYQAKYAQQYSLLIDRINQEQIDNKILSEQNNKHVIAYQSSLQPTKIEITNEIKKNNVYDTCIIPAAGVQFLNDSYAKTNKIKSS